MGLVLRKFFFFQGANKIDLKCQKILLLAFSIFVCMAVLQVTAVYTAELTAVLTTQERVLPVTDLRSLVVRPQRISCIKRFPRVTGRRAGWL